MDARDDVFKRLLGLERVRVVAVELAGEPGGSATTSRRGCCWDQWLDAAGTSLLIPFVKLAQTLAGASPGDRQRDPPRPLSNARLKP